MLVYRIRPDGVFDGEVELPDGPAIPPFHTRTAPPPIPANHHAVMHAGWEIVPGEAPPYVPPPPPPPEVVSPLQMRRALRAEGLYDAVTAYVAQQDADTQDAWEYATEIRRTDALITQAAAALGKSETEVDDLFRLAASI